MARPAIARYLLENNPVLARQRGDREGYPAGAQGMARCLKEWDDKWKAISNDTKRKGDKETSGNLPQV